MTPQQVLIAACIGAWFAILQALALWALWHLVARTVERLADAYDARRARRRDLRTCRAIAALPTTHLATAEDPGHLPVDTDGGENPFGWRELDAPAPDIPGEHR